MRIVCCLVLVLCMAGCGGVGEFVEFAKQGVQLEQNLIKELGDGVTVLSSMQNGRMSVTVNIPSKEFQTATVGEVERRVKAEVVAVWKQPLELYVGFHSPVNSAAPSQ
jgi:hypothetical protein